MDRLVLGRGEGCTVLKCVLLKISGLCVCIIDSVKKEKKKSEIKSNEFFFSKEWIMKMMMLMVVVVV